LETLKKIWNALFVEDSGVKKYFLNTGWLLIARGTQMIVSLIVGGLVARYLGPDQYGVYNYVISFVAIFAALSTMGIASVVVKDIVSGKTDEATALGSGFGLKLAGSILAYLLIIGMSFFVEAAGAVRLLLAIAAFQIITKTTEIINSYYQAKVASSKTVKAQLLSLIIINLLRITFILLDKPLLWFICLLPVDALIIGFGLVKYLSLTDAKISNWRFDRKYTKELLSESWPSLFSGIFVTIYMKIDQVMLQQMLGDTSVGYYAAAVRLSEVWLSIPWILSGSLFPAMVNAFKEGKSAFKIRINQAYILLISIALLVAIPIALTSPWIINLIFGAQYQESASVLTIHIFSCVFIFLGSVSNRWLIIHKLQRYWMYYSAAGALANVMLNIWLIPEYGILGAAYATLISYAFAYYFVFALFKPTRELFLIQTKNFFRVVTIIPAWKEIRKLRIR
jgi:O-antigen/teichoic acid export membrane protein